MRSRSAAISLTMFALAVLTGCTASVTPSPFARAGGLSRALRGNLRYAPFSSGQPVNSAQALGVTRQALNGVETAADLGAPAIDVPSAALSVELTLPKATPSGADIVLVASRDPNIGVAYARTYTWSVEARNGEYDMTVDFYALPGGTNTPNNPLIASVTVRVRVIPGDPDADTTPPERQSIAEITPGGPMNPDVRVRLNDPGSRNSSIVVAPDQVVAVGQTRQLRYVVRDANGNVLDLPPYGVVFQIEPGKQGVLEYAPDPSNPGAPSNGTVRGVSPGTASVTAAVDGVTSPPAVVTVVALLSISPETATLTLRQTQQFTVAVNGGASSAVTWSVLEGPAGGTIDANGVYTAPAEPGTFHVVATSQADPSRSATATVTVQAGSGTVIVQ